MWFRRDLRLEDNPALSAALRAGPVICLYILEADRAISQGSVTASDWWLDKSLRSLQADISALGGRLILRSGDARACLTKLLDQTKASAVFWNRRYDKTGLATDTDLASDLKQSGIQVEIFDGCLLTPPWSQTTKTGGYYRVFTPYWKAVRASYQPGPPDAAPCHLSPWSDLACDLLDDWALHPRAPDWSVGFSAQWQPGEAGAQARLQCFLSGPVDHYKSDRNRPDLQHGTSGLSPYLAFGEISPARIWRQVTALQAAGQIDTESSDVFLSELVWREFSYVLLYHHPDLAVENYNGRFDSMSWRDDKAGRRAWQKGLTGYPIVDAGMRQLWQTGWMHNRVRMVVASFLTKHLLIDWRQGEAWFRDCLVDADPASNSASWQWVAGCGADAAPYFRVFNPVTQGEKFDETGAYVHKWCPELRHLPRKYLYQPWAADPVTLKQAGLILGETYPQPIVEHKSARMRALEAYARMKESQMT